MARYPEELEEHGVRFNVEKVCQSYDALEVLKDISFTAEAGEVVALIGPNGSGKSTLIKTICNVKPALSGRIDIDGTDIAAMDKKDLAKLIGYVPQSYAYSAFSTVYDTVLIGRRPYMEWSYTRKDLRIAAEAMTAMKVDDLADRYVNELSGGQMQRVFLARALAQDPRFYLFDEPTSSLDLKNQLDAMKIMRSIVKTRGSGMIVALHDLNLALRYSDKTLVMKDKGVYAFGRPEDVIIERMIRDVYGVNAEIVEGKHGRYVQPYDDPDRDPLVATI